MNIYFLSTLRRSAVAALVVMLTGCPFDKPPKPEASLATERMAHLGNSGER